MLPYAARRPPERAWSAVRSDQRSPSGTRIAVTLGAVVAAVMLAIWGVTALAAGLSGGLQATPKNAAIAPAATKLPTSTTTATSAVPATSSAAVIATKPTPKPAVKPKAVTKPKPAPAAKVVAGKYVVVIDPGHGGDLPGSEPVGPWSGAPMVNRTNSGASGEAAVVLKVGLKLRPLLEAQGVKVIMTRTGSRAISNKDRAAIANAAHADLFLRLHCDGVNGSGTHGISMQIPGASNGWAPLGPSRKAGQMILSALVRTTGAADRGLAPRSDLVGFNWCKVPTCLPEMGFLSNPSEASKLQSDSYQNVLAKALASGTMAYLHTVR